MTDQSKIFISYGRQDEDAKDLLVSHLGVAERQGEFLVWDDGRIGGGDDWRDKIDGALESADIGVLLISRHFLTSKFIMNHEVEVLLERKHREGLRLYPILLSACDWQAVTWLERLNVKPLDARPLDSFEEPERDSQMSGMAKEIRHYLREDRETRTLIAKLGAEAEPLSERFGVSENVVKSFLAILGERHVEPDDCRETLREIAGQYQETLGQFSGIDRGDPVIEQLIEKAKVAIGDGDYDEADDLLTQSEQRDLRAAARSDHHRLNAAATRVLRGTTSLTRLRFLEAADHFAKAAGLLPNEHYIVKADYLALQGFALDQASRTLDAIDVYKSSISLDPDQTEPLISLGRLYRRAGDLNATKSTFESALAAAKKAKRRADLATIHMELGTVALDENDLDAAEKGYKDSWKIRRQLVEEHADDETLQQDLSDILGKIGDVLKKRGKINPAYTAYMASFEISKKITEKHEEKLEGFCHLAERLRKIGDIHVDRDELPDALAEYRESLRIVEDVIKKERRRHNWYRDLTVCHNKIGDVLRAQQDQPDKALEAYKAGLAIREHLTHSDPGNAGWRRDLLASSNKIGCVHLARGDLKDALAAFEESHQIAQHLAESDPNNAESRNDLSVTYEKIGDVRMELGDYGKARLAYQASNTIRRDLADKEPGNAEWQRSLIVSNEKMSSVALATKKRGMAEMHLQTALVLAIDLRDTNRLLPRDEWMVGALQTRIDALKGPAV